MFKLKIAIIGTHGVGKTALTKALSKELGLPLIPESARIVADEFSLKRCDYLVDNPELARIFQWRVLERQI